jgi:ribonuclease P protein component
LFKKINRLPSLEKISGTSLNSPSFSLKFKKNDLPHSRFGVVVSKTIDKSAVGRNLLKRRLRSCLEENLEEIKPGYDLLFIVSKGAQNKKREELCSEIKNVLKNQDIL